jgi:hypothetical protein
VHWAPNKRWSIEELRARFALPGGGWGGVTHAPKADLAAERVASWRVVWGWLNQRRMLRGNGLDLGGWQEMICPWQEEHSGRAATGAAIGAPSERNGWTGAFRCHHGACAQRGWRELMEWIVEQSSNDL